MTNLIINAFMRRLETVFPGYFQGPKHNHYSDFGWPTNLTFNDYLTLFRRNGLAKAGVEKTVLKTWQDNPELWLTDSADQSPEEKEVADHFEKIRFWQKAAEADRRSLVGGYSGLILRFSDGKPLNQPVDRVMGLEALVEVIPAWAGQLTVASWVTDQTDENYGQPSMFAFNEAQVPESTANNSVHRVRAFDVHPDRVIIWSSTGTVYDSSLLESGYNDLLTLEKVSGSGGEGFWKNAKSAPALKIDPSVKLKDLAQGMNVKPEEVADAMNEQVEAWQKGFDKLLLLQGMEPENLSVSLPSPEHFFNVALQSYSASINCPTRILVGNQTGERASTEDAKEWAQACNSRRVNVVRPTLNEVIQRFKQYGVLSDSDWFIHWSDLTEASGTEKLEKATKMSEINQRMPNEPVFLPEEIRQVLEMDPLDESDLVDEDEDEGELP